MSIQNVIDNGFCVGCGACKIFLSKKINITMHDDGFYKAKINKKLTDAEVNISSKACPFSSDAKNEDELGKKLFEGSHFDLRVGHYTGVFAGNIKDPKARINSSSGGLTTWFAEKLLKNNEIDAVIHVGESSDVFGYRISRTINELQDTSNKKSRYYPVSFEAIIESIRSSKERFLFIGVPCFIKSIRLLQQQSELLNVKYVVALLCGHMKSKAFSESYSWQMGVKPKEMKSIDFRVKVEGHKASDYFVNVISKDGESLSKRSALLFGSSWGYGFFKHKSCDFCDDIAGELADVTFGDAWSPKYTNDYLGTNIVISRSDVFDQYIKRYSEELEMEKVTVNDFYNTQAGNYRHRRDGLTARIEKEKGWVPTKRIFFPKQEITKMRAKLYCYRYTISRLSTKFFMVSKQYNSFFLFKVLMFPLLIRYEYLNSSNKIMFIRLIVKAVFPKVFISVVKRIKIYILIKLSKKNEK